MLLTDNGPVSSIPVFPTLVLGSSFFYLVPLSLLPIEKSSKIIYHNIEFTMLKMVRYSLLITLSIQNLEINQQTMVGIEQMECFLSPMAWIITSF